MSTLTSAVMRPSRRRLRFSLRTLIALTTVLCVALGYWVIATERQRAAVETVRKAGGQAHYTYEVDSAGNWRKNPQPWVPSWLLNSLGPDFFLALDGVYLEGARFDDEAIDSIVSKLRPVSSLHWLELRGTSITDKTLTRIAELTQLEKLFIRSEGDSPKPTPISDKGLAQFHSLHRLRHLSLGNCPIDGSAFEQLGALALLQELDLRGTQFNDAAASSLRHFPRLKYLNLWKTPITDAAAKQIAHLDRLEEFYFWGGGLSDAAMTEIAKLRHLKILDLDETKVSDVGIEALQCLSDLQELRLNYTLIKEPKLSAFQKLQTLKIGATHATDALLEEVGQLPELRDLDCFQCNDLTDAGIKHLENSKSLKRLFFPDRRKISANALRELQLARPTIKIVF